MFKKFIVGTGIALLAIFGTSLAAIAAPGDTYVAASAIVVSNSTPKAGEPTAVAFGNGAFNNGESVTFRVEGEGTATLAMVKAAVVTLTKTASATGAVGVTVTLPANATGTYTLTGTGLTSGTVGTAELTVASVDAGSVTSGPVSQMPLALIWIVGAAIVLGLVLMTVFIARRRRVAAHATK